MALMDDGDEGRFASNAVLRPEEEIGLGAVSSSLFANVTSYHAQIGASVSQADLYALEAKLLDDAEKTAGGGAWGEALNIFTHALAVTEKLRAQGDTSTQASTQGAIVMNCATCLHHLGEFEAVRDSSMRAPARCAARTAAS